MRLHHQTLPCAGLVLLCAVIGCGNNASTTPQVQTSLSTTRKPATTSETPNACAEGERKGEAHRTREGDCGRNYQGIRRG